MYMCVCVCVCICVCGEIAQSVWLLGYRLEDRGVVVWCQTSERLWGPQLPGPFLRDKEAGALSWPFRLYLVQRLRKCGVTPPLSHMPSWRTRAHAHTHTHTHTHTHIYIYIVFFHLTPLPSFLQSGQPDGWCKILRAVMPRMIYLRWFFGARQIDMRASM